MTPEEQPFVFDQERRGCIDYAEIARCLAMTPEERLQHHEERRLQLKETQKIHPIEDEDVKPLIISARRSAS